MLGLLGVVLSAFALIADAIERKTKNMRRELNDLSARIHRAEERLADLEFERDFPPTRPGDGLNPPSPRSGSLARGEAHAKRKPK